MRTPCLRRGDAEDDSDRDSREEWEAAEWEEAREEWGAVADEAPYRQLPPDIDTFVKADPRISTTSTEADLCVPVPTDGSYLDDGTWECGCDCPASPSTSVRWSEYPQASSTVRADNTDLTAIDEPLVLLEEETIESVVIRLRTALAMKTAARKGDRLALEEARAETDGVKKELATMRCERRAILQENRLLRMQLEDHHGIMAADWAQTLGFQERLKHEGNERERLVQQVAELRAMLDARAIKYDEMLEDAASWRMFAGVGHHSSSDIPTAKFDALVETCTPASFRLQAEVQRRSRINARNLQSELENQLCVVCQDAKKNVLFLPCAHVCVCEGCRVRLNPYRCPMCKQNVENFVGRVHF